MEMPVFVLGQPRVGIKDVPEETLCPPESLLQTGKTEEEFNSTALYLADLERKFKEFASQRSLAV